MWCAPDKRVHFIRYVAPPEMLLGGLAHSSSSPSSPFPWEESGLNKKIQRSQMSYLLLFLLGVDFFSGGTISEMWTYCTSHEFPVYHCLTHHHYPLQCHHFLSQKVFINKGSRLNIITYSFSSESKFFLAGHIFLQSKCSLFSASCRV